MRSSTPANVINLLFWGVSFFPFFEQAIVKADRAAVFTVAPLFKGRSSRCYFIFGINNGDNYSHFKTLTMPQKPRYTHWRKKKKNVNKVKRHLKEAVRNELLCSRARMLNIGFLSEAMHTEEEHYRREYALGKFKSMDFEPGSKLSHGPDGLMYEFHPDDIKLWYAVPDREQEK